jgi:hypothetical protein
LVKKFKKEVQKGSEFPDAEKRSGGRREERGEGEGRAGEEGANKQTCSEFIQRQIWNITSMFLQTV